MKKGFRQTSSRMVVLAGAALACALSFSAAADQVYTWTDENGVTHFSDREPPDTDTQVIDMAEKSGGVTYSKPQEASDGEAVAEDTTASAGADATPGQQRREQIAASSAERRAAQADQNAMCQKQRELLARLEPARRVYYTDDSGQEARMTDQQRMDAITETRNYIAQYCD
jgi:hypothetical protein